MEKWRQGHAQADVTIDISGDMAADDAAFKVVEDVLIFISKNPSKSKEWKERAEEALADQERGA